MSEGTNIELAHRDLGIEIEKLLDDRKKFQEDWRAMIQQIVNLEHTVKTLRRELKREQSRNALGGGEV